MNSYYTVSLGRDSSRLSSFEVLVVSSAIRRRKAHIFRASGSPVQLARILPSLRYAVRKMSGPELRAYLNTLGAGFTIWKALRSATP